ncbi:HAD hydrolase-like protein, partial [Mycobacterium tuberculosis]
VDVTPGRSVVVGDHVHDVRGARDAGAVCVAVATGRVSADDLRAAGAHTVLPDLTDPDALLAAVHASV